MKRDGSIITSVSLSIPYSLPDGSSEYKEEVTSDPDRVDLALFKVLQDNDDFLTKINIDPIREQIKWPTHLPVLPEMTIQDTESLLERLSTGKALAHFPLPDDLIKWALNKFNSRKPGELYTEQGRIVSRIKIFRNVWNKHFFKSYPEIFDCRLVPLNKAHPKVPKPNEMRPIVVTSPIYKLIEIRFADSLHDAFWKLKGFGPSQFGFMRGMTCASQINRILNKVFELYQWQTINNKTRIQPISSLNISILFIDFEQAYNSINMWKLYKRMKDEIQTKKLDLDPHHLDYIFFLVRQLKIHIGHQIFKPIHGVPQGGIISPTLFNFAMHYFLTDLAQTINSLTETQNTPHRQITPERTGMWADDLAFIIQHLHLNSKEGQSDLKYTIRAYSHHIYTIGLSWGLRVNWKKSALMPLNLGWRSNRYASLLSHSATNPMYDPKTKSCPIILQIITGRSILQINLPLVQSYKYLGIIMTQSLRWSKHLEKLRDKAEYISICFYSLRKAATESRFAYNMWTTFIRIIGLRSTCLLSCLLNRSRQTGVV